MDEEKTIDIGRFTMTDTEFDKYKAELFNRCKNLLQRCNILKEKEEESEVRDEESTKQANA